MRAFWLTLIACCFIPGTARATQVITDGQLGKVWVDAGDGKQIQSVPAMGQFSTGFLPLQVDSSGALKTTTSGGGGGSTPATCPNASFAAAAVGSGSATTFTAPAHAVAVRLLNESTTTFPIRWAFGSAATSSNGMYYEAGRDTEMMPFGTNLSVIGIGGTADVDVQWCLSQ